MRFYRQEYWSGLSYPSPGDLLDPGIKPMSLVSPALAGGFFTTRTTYEALGMTKEEKKNHIQVVSISKALPPRRK